MRQEHLRLLDETDAGQPLLVPVLRAGSRVKALQDLAQIRSHHAEQMRRLPAALRSLDPATSPYAVTVSDNLRALAQQVDAATWV